MSMCVSVNVCVGEYVCQRDSMNVSVCVCVSEKECESECVCMR